MNGFSLVGSPFFSRAAFTTITSCLLVVGLDDDDDKLSACQRSRKPLFGLLNPGGKLKKLASRLANLLSKPQKIICAGCLGKREIMASRKEQVIHIIVGIERHLATLKALPAAAVVAIEPTEPADGYLAMKNDPRLMID